ncbi:oxidoreductase [Kwoniella heveanensis CBS 569]|nr:oxidoreductase [Kwoniella heveanensis CBS 569]
MPFKDILLNDGRHIPAIGFGTWKIPKDVASGQVEQGIDVGFDHIDTAQVYRNEEEVGIALKESGLARKDFWLTTKWSGVDDKDPETSIKESLEKLKVDYVDLYLIHHPRLCKGDIEGTWKKLEKIKKEGYAKSIGVSNFSKEDLQELIASASIKPVVNQILLHPYVISSTTPLLQYMSSQHIVPEGYSTLIPLTSKPGGPVDKPVQKIADRLNVKPEQVLLAWSKAKDAVIVTTSSKKDRLEGYLDVGDIVLTPEDVKAIDDAGAKGELWEERKKKLAVGAKWTAAATLVGYALWNRL